MSEISTLLYHGTTKESAAALMRSKAPLHHYGRLGRGTYFWDDSERYARKWAERQIPDKERRVVSTMIRVKAENVLDLACPFVRRELMLFAESLSARDGAWERILRSLEPWEGELSAGGLLVELFAMRAPKEVKAVRAIHRVLASDEFLPPSLNRLKAARRQTGMLVNREIGFEFGYVIMWAVRDFSVLRGWSNPAISF